MHLTFHLPKSLIRDHPDAILCHLLYTRSLLALPRPRPSSKFCQIWWACSPGPTIVHLTFHFEKSLIRDHPDAILSHMLSTRSLLALPRPNPWSQFDQIWLACFLGPTVAHLTFHFPKSLIHDHPCPIVSIKGHREGHLKLFCLEIFTWCYKLLTNSSKDGKG